MGKRGPQARWAEENEAAEASGTSRLTQVHQRLAGAALGALGWKREFQWLADRKALEASGGRRGARWTILAELGRLLHDARVESAAARRSNLLSLARFLCEKRPLAQDAVILIRQFRRVRRPEEPERALITREDIERDVALLKRKTERRQKRQADYLTRITRT